MVKQININYYLIYIFENFFMNQISNKNILYLFECFDKLII